MPQEHNLYPNYCIAENKHVRIAISGASGCGNTTVSTLLANTLHIPCINYTFRNLAKEIGIPMQEIIEKAKTDPQFDRTVDGRQVEMAMQQSCVLGSRLAIWLLKEANLKVYLYASAHTRAARIFEREGGSFEQIKRFTEMRDAEDTRRYRDLYNIDNKDYSFADLCIDTEQYNPDSIVEKILHTLLERKLINQIRYE